jgi:hypothetical protein
VEDPIDHRAVRERKRALIAAAVVIAAAVAFLGFAVLVFRSIEI